MEKREQFYIITGGTRFKVAPYFSFSSDAYGSVGRFLHKELTTLLDDDPFRPADVVLIETRMAMRTMQEDDLALSVLRQAGMPVCREFGIPYVDTVDQMDKLLRYLTAQPDTRCIVMTSAICDFEAEVITPLDITKKPMTLGYGAKRLSSKERYLCQLAPADKLVDHIRKERKDIFLVLCKTTDRETYQMSYKKGLSLLKRTSANLVLANNLRENGDIDGNQIVTPEEYPYPFRDREDALRNLASMIADRTNLTFSRTKIVPGEPAYLGAGQPRNYGIVPENFLDVLDHLIDRGAFKPFRGVTTGHFGCRITPFDSSPHPEITFLSSARHSDHNKVFEEGMVAVRHQNGQLVGYGAKPSAGEHTQQMLFEAYPEIDCIVHFHSPLSIRGFEIIPRQRQRSFECGSHECALNTKEGFFLMDGLNQIWAVHLEGHGPNIGFSKDSDPEAVICFIERYWDLHEKEGGLIPDD